MKRESSTAVTEPAPRRPGLFSSLVGMTCGRWLWAFGGAAGCATVIAVLIGAALLASGLTLNNFLGNLGGLFRGGVPDYSDVYIPDVEAVRELNQLTTIRRSYSHVVWSERDMPALLRALYGDRLVMVAVGHIDAGVDLDMLTEDDLTYDAETQTLTIRLPQATLQDCFLDESKSYVVERATGIFAAPLPDIDNNIRRYAVSQYRDFALEDNILVDAQKRAEESIRRSVMLFNQNAEDLNIVLVSPTPDPNAPLPETCQ